MSCCNTTSSESLAELNSIWPVIYVITSDNNQLDSVVIDSSGIPSLLPAAADNATGSARPKSGSQPLIVYDEKGTVPDDVSIEEHEFVVSGYTDILALPPKLIRVPASDRQQMELQCMHGGWNGFSKSSCHNELAQSSSQHMSAQADCRPNSSLPLVYSACPRTAGILDINFRCPVVVCDRLETAHNNYMLQQPTCIHSPACHEIVIEDFRTAKDHSSTRNVSSPNACRSSTVDLPAVISNHSDYVASQDLANLTSSCDSLVSICNNRLQTICDENASCLPDSVSAEEIKNGIYPVDDVNLENSVHRKQYGLLEGLSEKTALMCSSKPCDSHSGSEPVCGTGYPTHNSYSPLNATPVTDNCERLDSESCCSTIIEDVDTNTTSTASADVHVDETFHATLQISETHCRRTDDYLVDCSDDKNPSLVESSRPATVDQIETLGSLGVAVNSKGSDLVCDVVRRQPEDVLDQTTVSQPVPELNMAGRPAISSDGSVAIQNCKFPADSNNGIANQLETLANTSHTNSQDHSQDNISAFGVDEICDNNNSTRGKVIDRSYSTVAGKYQDDQCSVNLNFGDTLPSNHQLGVCDVSSMPVADNVVVVNETSLPPSCAIEQPIKITDNPALVSDPFRNPEELEITAVEKSAGVMQLVVVNNSSGRITSGDSHQDDHIRESKSEIPDLTHVSDAGKLSVPVDTCVWATVDVASRSNVQTDAACASHVFDFERPSNTEQSKPVCTEDPDIDETVASVETTTTDVLHNCKSNNLSSNAVLDFAKLGSTLVNNAVDAAPSKRRSHRLQNVTAAGQSVNSPPAIYGHRYNLAAVENYVASGSYRKSRSEQEAACRSRRRSVLPLVPSDKSNLESCSTNEYPSAIKEFVKTGQNEPSLSNVCSSNGEVHRHTDTDSASGDDVIRSKTNVMTMVEDSPATVVQPTVDTPSDLQASSNRTAAPRSRRQMKDVVQSPKLANMNDPISNVDVVTSSQTPRVRRVRFMLTDEQAGTRDQIAADKNCVIVSRRRSGRSCNVLSQPDPVSVPVFQTPPVVTSLPTRINDSCQKTVPRQLDEKELRQQRANLGNVIDTVIANSQLLLPVRRENESVGGAVGDNLTNVAIRDDNAKRKFALLTRNLNSKIVELEQCKINLLSQLHIAKQQAAAGPEWYEVCSMTRSDCRKRKYESLERELSSRAEALDRKELLVNKKIRRLHRKDIDLDKWSEKLENERCNVVGMAVMQKPRESLGDNVAGMHRLEEMCAATIAEAVSCELDETELHQQRADLENVIDTVIADETELHHQRANLENVIDTVIANSKVLLPVGQGNEPIDGSDGIGCKHSESAETIRRKSVQ